MSILGFFKAIGRGILKALQFAERHGLTDDLIDRALSLVTRAQLDFPDNDTRREWVVGQLTSQKVPESVARLAIELAVQAYKQRVG